MLQDCKPSPDSYRQLPTEIVCETDEFLWRLDRKDLGDGKIMTFMHLYVYVFTPAIMHTMKALFDLKRSEFPNIIFAQGEVDDDKFERFAAHFGFKPISDCICTDGVNRRLFVNYYFGKTLNGRFIPNTNNQFGTLGASAGISATGLSERTEQLQYRAEERSL